MSRALRLYRSILKSHKSLPVEMRVLGDEYVRNEFRLHLKAKPEQLIEFYTAWESYLDNIQAQMIDIGRLLNDVNISPILY